MSPERYAFQKAPVSLELAGKPIFIPLLYLELIFNSMSEKIMKFPMWQAIH